MRSGHHFPEASLGVPHSLPQKNHTDPTTFSLLSICLVMCMCMHAESGPDYQDVRVENNWESDKVNSWWVGLTRCLFQSSVWWSLGNAFGSSLRKIQILWLDKTAAMPHKWQICLVRSWREREQGKTHNLISRFYALLLYDFWLQLQFLFSLSACSPTAQKMDVWQAIIDCSFPR